MLVTKAINRRYNAEIQLICLKTPKNQSLMLEFHHFKEDRSFSLKLRWSKIRLCPLFICPYTGTHTHCKTTFPYEWKILEWDVILKQTKTAKWEMQKFTLNSIIFQNPSIKFDWEQLRNWFTRSRLYRYFIFFSF